MSTQARLIRHEDDWGVHWSCTTVGSSPARVTVGRGPWDAWDCMGSAEGPLEPGDEFTKNVITFNAKASDTTSDI